MYTIFIQNNTHSYIMNSVEKKPYDQEKVAFLETVTSTEGQMWVICSTAWVRWRKRQNSWWINYITAQIETSEISIFLLGKGPLLSVSNITELAATALKAKNSNWGSLVMGIALGGPARLAPAPWPPHSPPLFLQHSCTKVMSHIAPRQPLSWEEITQTPLDTTSIGWDLWAHLLFWLKNSMEQCRLPCQASNCLSASEIHPKFWKSWNYSRAMSLFWDFHKNLRC